MSFSTEFLTLPQNSCCQRTPFTFVPPLAISLSNSLRVDQNFPHVNPLGNSFQRVSKKWFEREHFSAFRHVLPPDSAPPPILGPQKKIMRLIANGLLFSKNPKGIKTDGGSKGQSVCYFYARHFRPLCFGQKGEFSEFWEVWLQAPVCFGTHLASSKFSGPNASLGRQQSVLVPTVWKLRAAKLIAWALQPGTVCISRCVASMSTTTSMSAALPSCMQRRSW